MKVSKIHINQWQIFKDVEIDFTDSDGKPLPLVILAGVNGTGKSTLLNMLSDANKLALDKLNPDKSKHYFVDFELKNTNSIVSLTVQEEIFELGLFKGFPNKFSESWLKQYSIENSVERLIKKYVFEKEQTAIQAKEEINKRLKQLNPAISLQIDKFKANEFDIIFKNDYGNIFNVAGLSSGEKHILETFFTLHFNEVKDKLVLIDEPDKSLHSSWQYQLADLYYKYAIENNCQIIMATHSPFILSSVKSEQVRIFYKTEEGIKVEKPAEEIHGWNIERILQYYMETHYVRDIDTDKELKSLIKLAGSGETDDSFFKRFEKLEETLGYADSDVVAIRLLIKKQEQNEAN